MSKNEKTEQNEQMETAENEQTAAKEEQENTPETESADEAAVTDDWEAKYEEVNDRFLRLAAEYDNFRKRSRQERDKAYHDAVSHVVKELLSTYDNLARALAAQTTDTEYKKGIEMTMNQLMDSLKKLDVNQIEAEVGTSFDPNLHNAVMHIEDEALGESVIAEVFQQGFTVGDKVIRHAMVKVAN